MITDMLNRLRQNNENNKKKKKTVKDIHSLWNLIILLAVFYSSLFSLNLKVLNNADGGITYSYYYWYLMAVSILGYLLFLHHEDNLTIDDLIRIRRLLFADCIAFLFIFMALFLAQYSTNLISLNYIVLAYLILIDLLVLIPLAIITILLTKRNLFMGFSELSISRDWMKYTGVFSVIFFIWFLSLGDKIVNKMDVLAQINGTVFALIITIPLAIIQSSAYKIEMNYLKGYDLVYLSMFLMSAILSIIAMLFPNNILLSFVYALTIFCIISIPLFINHIREKMTPSIVIENLEKKLKSHITETNGPEITSPELDLLFSLGQQAKEKKDWNIYLKVLKSLMNLLVYYSHSTLLPNMPNMIVSKLNEKIVERIIIDGTKDDNARDNIIQVISSYIYQSDEKTDESIYKLLLMVLAALPTEESKNYTVFLDKLIALYGYRASSEKLKSLGDDGWKINPFIFQKVTNIDESLKISMKIREVLEKSVKDKNQSKLISDLKDSLKYYTKRLDREDKPYEKIYYGEIVALLKNLNL